jgi:eukaryotic-like serine/threonine-protein kinase
MSPWPQSAPDPSRLGRYVIGRRLAAGGMGEVYVAVRTGVGDFRKPLALKVMLPDIADDPVHVRLFLREASLAAKLAHPNIVTVYDAGRADGRYFIAMELVDGVALSTVARSLRSADRSLDAGALCHIARETLEGLRCAHELRDEDGTSLEIIHRDISPSNILVSRRGEVKLTDFGVAKMRGAESNTGSGELRGKLEYLAPELLNGASATVRSDLYALGVTLYRMATLESPFTSSDVPSPAALLFRNELIPLSHRRPDLPSELSLAIDRAIASNPGSRFPTAAAMMEAIPRGDFEARRQALVAVIRAVVEDNGPAPAPMTLATPQLVVDSCTELLVPDQRETRLAPPDVRPRRRTAQRLALAAGVAVTAILVALVEFRGSPSSGEGPLPPPAVASPAAAPVPLAEARPSPPPSASAPSPGRQDGDSDTAPAANRPPPPPAERRVLRLTPPARLTIQAEPWAHVELNGKRVGQTPLARYPVATEKAIIRLWAPGYVAIERRLTLSAGEERKINETLSQVVHR